MDRNSTVDQVGGKEMTEVVRGEMDVGQLRVFGGEVSAPALQHVQDPLVAQDLAGGAGLALQQERQRVAKFAFVGIPALDQRDGCGLLALVPDQGGNDVEQLGRHTY